jgi:hypothetical protein
MVRIISIAAIAALAGSAQAQTITFNELEHGRIVNSQYTTMGVTIAANNFARSFDLAVAFDTQRTGTADPDLEDPWDRGNIPTNTRLGKMLILQENNIGIGDGIANSPDDEGDRPAGEFIFTFSRPMTKFGTDIVDIESDTAESGGLKFYRNNTLLAYVTWAMFLNPASSYYDASIALGNNSANRISPIFASRFGVDGFDKVIIKMGGSGGVDNIVLPAPASSLLLAGLFGLRRRR